MSTERLRAGSIAHCTTPVSHFSAGRSHSAETKPKPQGHSASPAHGHRSSDLHQLPLPSPKLRQIDGVQMLRGVAVVSVALLHAGQMARILGGRAPLPDLGISGVDLFFVISGFILCLLTIRDRHDAPGLRSAAEFLCRRIARILPVYWIFALPDIVHHLHHGWGEFRPYAPALFLLPGGSYPALPLLANFSWTLIFEMFFYLLLSCILLITVHRAVHVVVAVLLLLVGIGCVAGIQRPWLNIICSPMLLEFAFGGMIAALYAAAGSGTRRLGIGLVAVGSLAAVTLAALNCAWIAPDQDQILAGRAVLARALTWGLSYALILAGVVLWSPSLKSRVGSASVAMGNASYSAYLLSGLILIKIGRPFQRFGQTHTITSWTALAIVQIAIVVVLMLAGILFYRFVERPLIRRTYHLLARS